MANETAIRAYAVPGSWVVQPAPERVLAKSHVLHGVEAYRVSHGLAVWSDYTGI